MIKIVSMCLGMAATNCYFVYRDTGTEPSKDAPVHGVFIDVPAQGERIFETLREKGMEIDLILLTHAHYDHIGGAEELRKCTGAEIWCHEEERVICEDPEANVSYDFGHPMTIVPDRYLRAGDTIALHDDGTVLLNGSIAGKGKGACPDDTVKKEPGGADRNAADENGALCFEVLYTPGHTIGGCSYYAKAENVVFSGDTLFRQSVGRTDLPTGSMSTLVRSIREQLFVLPDETEVYPGHMGPTTIGDEKMYNPFL